MLVEKYNGVAESRIQMFSWFCQHAFVITCHNLSLGITRTCMGSNTTHTIAVLILGMMKTKNLYI